MEKVLAHEFSGKGTALPVNPDLTNLRRSKPADLQQPGRPTRETKHGRQLLLVHRGRRARCRCKNGLQFSWGEHYVHKVEIVRRKIYGDAHVLDAGRQWSE